MISRDTGRRRWLTAAAISLTFVQGFIACEHEGLRSDESTRGVITIGQPETEVRVADVPVEPTMPDVVDAPEDVPEPSPPCEAQCPSGFCGDDGCGEPCTCPLDAPICFGGQCQLDPPPDAASCQLSALLIDFGTVAPGTVIERPVTLKNTGLSPLQVTSFTIEGNATLAMVQDESLWRSISGAPITVVFVEPWTLNSAETLVVNVRFTPVDSTVQQAQLTFHTSDPAQPEGAALRLRGGPSEGCLEAEPPDVDFGPVVLGEPEQRQVSLVSCGNLATTLSSLTFEGSEAFSLGADLQEDVIPADGSLIVPVIFSPTLVETVEEAQLVVDFSSEAGQRSLSLPLKGVGVADHQPIPKIVMNELSPTQPGVVVHLDGRESYAPQGGIGLYQWSVVGPPAAKLTLQPSIISPQVTTVVDVIGDYTFSLGVMDAQGTMSPELAQTTLAVEPWATLHVELVWSTADDLDAFDVGPAAGTDLDLHLIREDAVGVDVDGDGQGDGWFDVEADCYWFNPFPDWGDYSLPTNDDPFLQRADADGWGPEYLVFDLPKDGMTYRLGVHAWSDHGFGPSSPTLRVYVLGDLVFEATLPSLEQGELWEVATVQWQGWPNALVTSRDFPSGLPRVFQDVSPAASSD